MAWQTSKPLVSIAASKISVVSCKKDPKTVDIQSGKPQHNAYIERYNQTIWHEWLDQNIFETIDEAQSPATKWLWSYKKDKRIWMVLCGAAPL